MRIWVVGVLAVLVAGTVAFLSWRIPETLGAYLIAVLSMSFCAGVVCIAYIALSWWQDHEDLYRALQSAREQEVRDVLFEENRKRNRSRMGWTLHLGAFLVLISLVGFVAIFLRPDWRRANASQIIVQYSLPPGKAPVGQAGSVAIENTLTLDPELKAELQEYLKNSSSAFASLSKSSANEGSPFSPSSITFWLILAAVVLLFTGILIALKKGKEI